MPKHRDPDTRLGSPDFIKKLTKKPWWYNIMVPIHYLKQFYVWELDGVYLTTWFYWRRNLFNSSDKKAHKSDFSHIVIRIERKKKFWSGKLDYRLTIISGKSRMNNIILSPTGIDEPAGEKFLSDVIDNVTTDIQLIKLGQHKNPVKIVIGNVVGDETEAFKLLNKYEQNFRKNQYETKDLK